MKPYTIWFWQRIVSPHMTGLAVSLARKGCHVTYVAEQILSSSRATQGWLPPELCGVKLELVQSPWEIRRIAQSAPDRAIHICQGIRANGLVGVAFRELAKQRRCLWIVMETVDDSGWRRLIKRFEYRRLFKKNQPYLAGVLATGYSTPNWVVARCVPEKNVYPFAYFLPDDDTGSTVSKNSTGPFRFIFVGQFIERKRFDLLITALAPLASSDIELVVVGSGPLEETLRKKAVATFPGKVKWLGRLSMAEVRQEMKQADCLVLPSRHDGWGAVVSEALLSGTPAICSDSCGVAGVIKASRVGGVFSSGDQFELTRLLGETYQSGRLNYNSRVALMNWSKSLGSDSGASYLISILEAQAGLGKRPSPPWIRK